MRIRAGGQAVPRQPTRTQSDTGPRPQSKPAARHAAHTDTFAPTGPGSDLGLQLAKATSRSPVRDPAQGLMVSSFRARAQDRDGFHTLMKTAFGSSYDRTRAEQIRTRAKRGDMRWLPQIRYVDNEVLGGAHGAYDKTSKTVLLNRSLASDPEKAASTYVEEAGHHLDTLLNKKDAVGDEGELFRRLLAQEKLSAKTIRDIRSENDKGMIRLDGRRVEVEFWSPWKAIVRGAKKVKNAAVSVVDAAVSVGEAVKDTVVQAATGVGEGIVGFGKNLASGRVGAAFGALARGVDRGVLQAPSRLVNGVAKGAQQLIDGVTPLLGPLKKPVRWFSTRVVDSIRTAADTATGIARDVVRTPFEAGAAFVKGQRNAFRSLLRGDFKKALGQFGQSFVSAGTRVVGGAADVVFRTVAGVGSIVGTPLGLEDPSRGLTPAEKEKFAKIYGGSVDLSLVRIKRGGLGSVGSARVVGNTIYFPKNKGYFLPDGGLTARGRRTLVHEMGHVWQNQNGGGDYMHRALWASRFGARPEAYDWRRYAAQGVAFRDLNPEAQAEAIESITELGGDPQAIVAGAWVSRGRLNEAEAQYLREALVSVRAGEVD